LYNKKNRVPKKEKAQHQTGSRECQSQRLVLEGKKNGGQKKNNNLNDEKDKRETNRPEQTEPPLRK